MVNNYEAVRLQLEEACKIVTSSNVSKEQRTNSENLFLEFHKSKSPYELCRYLLETSKEPYLLFQAVSTLQEATLREWTLLSPDLIAELQNFLLNYVIQSSSSTPQFGSGGDKYVQQQILLTIAVFYKRSKLDAHIINKHSPETISGTSKFTTNIVKDIIEVFKTGNVKLQQICCSLMLALLNEFSNTNRSTKLGLSSDSHFTAKRSFEQNEFKLMLMFIYDTTQNLINSLTQNNIKSIRTIDKDSKEMLLQLFTLCDQSFSWEFTSSKHILKNLIGNFSQSNNTNNSTQSGNLEPTPEFKDFFVNQSLVSLLFKCYVLVRDDPDMAHASIQSIIQLSTLNGPIFKDDELTIQYESGGSGPLRVQFLNNFLENFLSTFSNIQIKEHETFNLACLMENLMLPVNIKRVNLINTQLVEAFFNIVCGFVMNCFKAEKTSTDSTDGKKYLESYEKVLISWTSIKNSLDYNEKIFDMIYKNYSQTLVEAFIQSRLSSFGNETNEENIQLNDDGVDVESLEDDDDDDSSDDFHRYKEILYSIGEFSKYSLDYCLPMLSKLLNERYIQLTNLLKQIIQQNLAVKAGNSVSSTFDVNIYTKHITNLSEEIHWLLLVSGFVLFEINSDLEQSNIPTEIMKYSIMCSSYGDLNLVSKLFSSLNQLTPFQPTQTVNNITNSINLSLIEAILNDSDRCDPIIRLFYNTFQLCELENYMFNLNLLQYLSPQVATSLMWFLKELARGYLFMREQNYEDLSPSLQLVFGQDTECGILILNYLLRKLSINFYIWSAENTTTIQTAKLLLEIVKHKEMSKILLQNEQFWTISKVAVINEMPWILLPSNVKKIIIKSLVVSCSTQNLTDQNEMQAHFFNTILKPLTERFDALNLIKSESIHTESCIKEVMSLIETLNGVIEGSTKNLIKDLMPFVLPRLQQGVQLLDVYHNYGEIVELILFMFNCIIGKFLAHLNDWPDAKNQIYHSFLCLIQVFSKHNSGKKSIEANVEEDYYNDLLLFMTLLNTLHNTDSLNEDTRFLSNQNSNTTSTNQLTSVDIILMGLEFLIPLMNQEMLKFQALSIEYFKLISHVAYSSPEKLFSKSFQLFSTLVSSVEYGINSSLGSEVVRYSLECITPLCNRIFITQSQNTEYGMCLRNLFKVVFDVIFRNSFEMDLFEVCSSVLYSFICCYQDTYSVLVGQLIEQYSDENIKQKIIVGFHQLTPQNFQFNIEKRNRLKFNTKFNEFCVKTYGLLFIR